MSIIPKFLKRKLRKPYRDYYTKEEILRLTEQKLQNPKVKKNMKFLFYGMLGMIVVFLILNNLTIHGGSIKYKYHWVK